MLAPYNEEGERVVYNINTEFQRRCKTLQVAGNVLAGREGNVHLVEAEEILTCPDLAFSAVRCGPLLLEKHSGTDGADHAWKM
jgi:hypothetical protein